MLEFSETIAEIITGLGNGSFEANSEEPAKGDDDFQEAVNVTVSLLNGRYTRWHLLAAETHIRETSSHVTFDEIGDYLDDTFLTAGATVESTLQDWAAADCAGELGELYEALDKAGGVDRFDWGSYANDGMTPTNGLTFIRVPAPVGESGVYLFQER